MLDFKERLQQVRWIGRGNDSDVELAALYDIWLLNHNTQLLDTNTPSTAAIPPPRMYVSSCL